MCTPFSSYKGSVDVYSAVQMWPAKHCARGLDTFTEDSGRLIVIGFRVQALMIPSDLLGGTSMPLCEETASYCRAPSRPGRVKSGFWLRAYWAWDPGAQARGSFVCRVYRVYGVYRVYRVYTVCRVSRLSRVSGVSGVLGFLGFRVSTFYGNRKP